MKIAFVTYEYAGTAGGGGIGTYARNAASMLAARGHHVEVFTAGDHTEGASGVAVHSVATTREAFQSAVVPVFAARHAQVGFDVIEGAEYKADAAGVAEAFPDVPLVVKLHTPSFLISEMNHQFLTWTRKARFLVGGLVRGRVPRPYWWYEAEADAERAHTLRADEVTAPSRAIMDLLRDRWGLDSTRLFHVPNVFVPPEALLAADPATKSGTIVFIGRLEVRKGVMDLAAAIPDVLRRHPGARFRFVGRALPHPVSGRSMRTVLADRIGPHVSAVEFVDSVPYEEVVAYIAAADICVFPSMWENFPNVCLESMAAARGVVASASGGMAEMVENGETGLLVQPGRPRELAEAIVRLLDNPAERAAMGVRAREHIRRAYGPEAIAPLQEESYSRAIARRNEVAV